MSNDERDGQRLRASIMLAVTNGVSRLAVCGGVTGGETLVGGLTVAVTTRLFRREARSMTEAAATTAVTEMPARTVGFGAMGRMVGMIAWWMLSG